jgi:hypothetical protein
MPIDRKQQVGSSSGPFQCSVTSAPPTHTPHFRHAQFSCLHFSFSSLQCCRSRQHCSDDGTEPVFIHVTVVSQNAPRPRTQLPPAPPCLVAGPALGPWQAGVGSVWGCLSAPPPLPPDCALSVLSLDAPNWSAVSKRGVAQAFGLGAKGLQFIPHTATPSAVRALPPLATRYWRSMGRRVNGRSPTVLTHTRAVPYAGDRPHAARHSQEQGRSKVWGGGRAACRLYCFGMHGVGASGCLSAPPPHHHPQLVPLVRSLSTPRTGAQ